MESRQPITRTSLEAKIEAAQAKLDDPIKRKSYTEAGPLQEDLGLLVKKREDLPTVEELKDNAAKVEKAVAEAANNRALLLWHRCKLMLITPRENSEASSDDASQDANEHVKEELPVSIDGFESRADLERGIVDLQNQIKQATARKAFKPVICIASGIGPSLFVSFEQP